MKYAFTLFLSLVLTGCLPFGEPEQIQVEGEARVEALPDLFEISASISSRRESRESALAEVAEIYGMLQDQLPTLEGLEKFKITTSTASVRPIYDYRCEQESYNEEDCPIIAYGGRISIAVEGSPAEIAGNMLSLASELGASEVEFDAFRVSAMADYQREAMKAAVENARQKAELIAEASNSTISGAIKIQSGRGFDKSFFTVENDMIVVTGSRLRAPSVDLDIKPQPVVLNASVVAAFEIE